MAYHGYINFMKHFLNDVENAKILEIGVHSGQTMIPLVQHYTLLRKPFGFTGVDVLMRDYLQVILENMIIFEKQDVQFHEMTSLDFLKDCNEKYDLIHIDGNTLSYWIYYDIINSRKYATDTTILVLNNMEIPSVLRLVYSLINKKIIYPVHGFLETRAYCQGFFRYHF